MEVLVPIVCALIGSGASTAIVTALINHKAEEKKKETGESQGIKWLMQDRLEHVALAYLSKGEITYDELKNWNRGHYIYHNLLGGNGDLDALKEALQDMYNRKGE
jgi:hypothetical protein